LFNALCGIWHGEMVFFSIRQAFFIQRPYSGFCRGPVPTNVLKMISFQVLCCIFATIERFADLCCGFAPLIDLLPVADAGQHSKAFGCASCRIKSDQEPVAPRKLKPIYITDYKQFKKTDGKYIAQKKCLPPVREEGIFWSDVSVFLRPVTLVRVAVLPRLVVIIPLTPTIATFYGQKNNKFP
jgi:hypothetical protein